MNPEKEGEDGTTTDPKRNKFLWVEDEKRQLNAYVTNLGLRNVEVLAASTLEQGLDLLGEHHQEIRCAVVEIAIPLSDGEMVPAGICNIARGGERAGLVLGQIIRARYPEIKVVGYSGGSDSTVIDWFQIVGDGYLVKNRDIFPANALEIVERTLLGERKHRYRPFIVHGHDHEEMKVLASYIQDTLKMARPVILQREPSKSRTIFQKLEDLARLSSLVFVLLTPDDLAHANRDPSDPAHRARQNVIFELGYFLGRHRSEQRRLIVLKKGELELPSDIEDLICIDVTGGIQAADREIQRELEGLGILPR